MRIFPIGAFAALAVMSFACTPAYAQEVASSGTLKEAIAELVASAVVAFVPVVMLLGSWVLMTLRKKLRLSIDEQHRNVLLPALQAGLRYARTLPRVQNGDLRTEATVADLIDAATSYVFKRVPDAAKHFNLDRPQVRDLLLARLGESLREPSWVAAEPARAMPPITDD